MNKRILCIFLALTIILCPLASSITTHAEKGGRNAYLAVYFDENMCKYRYEAVESGEMLEYSHVSAFLPRKELKFGKDSSKKYVYGLQTAVKESDKRECISNVKVNSNGYIELAAKKGDNTINNFKSIKAVSEKDCLPLTFPALGITYSEKDLQRCNDIINTLCKDFDDALSYINDGNIYTDQDYFHKMVLALISTQNGGILTNGYGHQYKIEWSEDRTMHNYAKLCTITGISDSYSSGSQTFVYKIKKGYVGADTEYGETMENGQKNKVKITDEEILDKVTDTYWISWETLYLEAEMLYAEGITYGTKNDLHKDNTIVSSTLDTLKNSMFKHNTFLSNLTMDKVIDLVYNEGVYDSNSYVFGIYKQSTNNTVFTVFLAFAAITVSLLSISVIKMINERQTQATYNAASRANLLTDIKRLIMSLFAIAFSWQIFKLLFMLNFYFVKIWASFLKENYSFVYISTTMAGDTLIEIALIIVFIYIDVLYVLRSIFVPILMASSPIFLYLYTLGGNYQRITTAWFKELLGAIFMQSIHAFVLAFVLMVAQDTNGITQVIVWASVIPLTKMFRDMCGLGGKELFAAAKGLSGTAASSIGAGAGAVGSVGGSLLGASMAGTGAATGAVLDAANAAKGISSNYRDSFANRGFAVGKSIGRTMGGFAQVGVGVGSTVASGGEQGSGEIVNGLKSMGGGVGQIFDANTRFNAARHEKADDPLFNASVLKSGISNRFNNQAPNFALNNQGGIMQAKYRGPSAIGNPDTQLVTPFDDKKGAIVNAGWNTGMTQNQIRSLYRDNNLGSKSYQELQDKKDIFAKLACDINAYENIGKVNNKQAQNTIASNYIKAQEFMGVSNLSVSTSSTTIGSGKDKQTVKSLMINGGGTASL